jgi:hypothetical protein
MNIIIQYKQVLNRLNTKSIEQRIIEAFNKCKESSI